MAIEDDLLCVLAAVVIQKKKTMGMISEGLIALVTWNTRGSQNIFMFKYNCYRHFCRLGFLGWRLLRSDKTKVFLNCLVSPSFEIHVSLEIRKLLTLFKPYLFIDRSPRIFNKDFVFVACTRFLMIKIM